MAAFTVAGHRWMFRESSQLTEQPDTCLFIENGAIDLAIPVARLADLDAGIKDALACHLNHFCESLRGILISYTKLRLLSPDITLSEVPSSQQQVTVHGTFVVLRPEKGRLLTGVITRVNPHHIGCLVMKTFTASLRADSGSNINFEGLYSQGEEITFVVDHLAKEGFVRITGILTDDLIMNHRNSQPPGTVYRNTDDVYALMVQDVAEKKRKKAARKSRQAVQHSDELAASTSILKAAEIRPMNSRSEKSSDSGISPGRTEISFPFSATDDMASDATISVTSSKKKNKKHRRESTDDSAVAEDAKKVEVEIAPLLFAEPSQETSTELGKRKKHKKRKDDLLAEGALLFSSVLQTAQDDQSSATDASDIPSRKKKKKRHHDEIDLGETSPAPEEAAADASQHPKKKKRKLSEIPG